MAHDENTDIFDNMDRLFQARLARRTLGVSPASLAEVYLSWLAHLSLCPGRLSALASFPARQAIDLATDSFERTKGKDPRFSAPDWSNWPWKTYVDTFHSIEAFWDLATKDIPGLSPQNERSISFAARQLLDALSPSNFLATNPELLFKTINSGGMNLWQGAANAFEDYMHNMTGKPPAGMENFKPGEHLAVTKGKVVFRNDLIELIQYDPVTPKVYKEPVLILPAWIMKYYILDLSPHNSLVKWLVEQGHSVFIVSWKNPDDGDRNKDMDDYVRDGALAAIDAVSGISGNAPVHLAGYCLGGTLAMITASLLAQEKDERIKTLTLLAAQGDFADAGEMMLFITPSGIAYLENMMWAQGYLDTKQMAGAFQMLRSNDLIWSRMVKEYMMGERGKLFDIMAWNADATRMPYKMHSEYLERLFLNNEFSDGHYTVTGQTIAPENITAPVFAVGTQKDHVAPWQSVYKVHLMVNGEITFALTSGGHNAGIVSEPGNTKRSYHIAVRKPGAPWQSADEWEQNAELLQGSWWPAWSEWLKDKSSPEKIPAPAKAGNGKYKPLCDAPGTYIHQK